jgi:hypothetical protein
MQSTGSFTIIKHIKQVPSPDTNSYKFLSSYKSYSGDSFVSWPMIYSLIGIEESKLFFIAFIALFRSKNVSG